ncbi:hypothetical protein EVAR_51550_1 [Eumeta japonica]|uniref:Uncharacterized protein n=1 Tax=Eumeta variegata TaxID=151549 RepID=A0A4C1YE33_EUMVA|nr:hypothetical protein EVAR_51550_1 [Eumeta japonica]
MKKSPRQPSGPRHRGPEGCFFVYTRRRVGNVYKRVRSAFHSTLWIRHATAGRAGARRARALRNAVTTSYFYDSKCTHTHSRTPARMHPLARANYNHFVGARAARPAWTRRLLRYVDRPASAHPALRRRGNSGSPCPENISSELTVSCRALSGDLDLGAGTHLYPVRSGPSFTNSHRRLSPVATSQYYPILLTEECNSFTSYHQLTSSET